MRRPVFTCAAALSLLLCVATAALWVQSLFAGLAMDFAHGFGSHGRAILGSIASQRGKTVQITYWWDNIGRIDHEGVRFRTFQPLPFATTFGFSHFVSLNPMPGLARDEALCVPHLFVILLCAILPSWWILLRARARKARCRNGCPECGYDLRASPERCPERGTPVPKNAEAAA